MLCITGTQRSGTSLIAMALEKSGNDLGSSLWDEEALGGYENDTICSFYREYLGDPTFPFDDYELYCPEDEILKRFFIGMNNRVVKFSYLLMNPVFGLIWHKYRSEDDTFLVMNRVKEDVVASKKRVWHRFRHDSSLLQQVATELEFNYRKSLCFLEEHYNVRVLQFPECVENLDGINAALGALDPEVQIRSTAWESVLDNNKIHFGESK